MRRLELDRPAEALHILAYLSDDEQRWRETGSFIFVATAEHLKLIGLGGEGCHIARDVSERSDSPQADVARLHSAPPRVIDTADVERLLFALAVE